MQTAPNAIALPDQIRTFLSSPHVASIATTDPDGQPRQAVVWYLLERDDLIINSRVGRRWPANLLRDGRISIAVVNGENGLHWVGLSGWVEPIEDQEQAQADIAAMARRYESDQATAERKIREFRTQQRISFRVRVGAIHDHLT